MGRLFGNGAAGAEMAEAVIKEHGGTIEKNVINIKEIPVGANDNPEVCDALEFLHMKYGYKITTKEIKG